MRLKNRLAGVKGSSYLTRGADDYDHRGLKKALRAMGRDLIQEAIEEAHEEASGAAPVSYRLVIFTQVYENYGYRWKPKGGNEYHIQLGYTTCCDEVSRILVDNHRHLIERTGDDDGLHSFSEHITGWSIYGSDEKTYEERMEEDSSPEVKEHYRARRETGWLREHHN